MKIHFVGIGGIGVSALAHYYLEKGHKVSGSDLALSEITKDLKNLGAKIFIGPHQAKCLTSEVKQVIHSVAADKNNPEIKRAQELGIKIQTYPQALGELTKKYFTIAICGAHGKGTTTAMTSLILIKAGFDPTVIIGTKLKEFNDSNCRIGESKYLIIEADEYKEAFLNYWPQIIALTNIDKEHLDCYKDLDHVIDSFKKFIDHLPENGVLILNKDDENILKLKTKNLKQQLKVKNYSLNQIEAKKLEKTLKIPGQHNISNALAALTVARILKIPDKISYKALSEYQGAWRRFEIINTKLRESARITVISDYAHHPTEVKATLQAARQKFPKRKLWAVFQPHQYQRTYYLFNEFTSAFDRADEIVITQIYSVAGREEKDIIDKVKAEDLVQAIQKQGKKVHFIQDFKKIPQFLRRHVSAQDVVLVMGAGSIYKIVEKLV